MKKITSILLVLAMILAFSVTAFAAGDNTDAAAEVSTTTLNIADSDGRTYEGYQLLKLTTSMKQGEHHTEHDGEHTKDCYNYAYTVNAKYREIFQEEVYSYGGNYLWGESGRPATAAGITDAQILKYLENQTGGNGTLRQVADRIYRAILEDGIDADKPDLTGTNDVIEQGYWLFADVTELDGNEANSLVMADTAGEIALNITPKTALPTVEKKVKDIDDSEDDNILDNPWQDTADHDIGDTVPFKLTATLPDNAQAYETYQIIFHDTLSAGLTFDEDSVRVLMYDTKHKADVDTDLNDQIKDVTEFFVTDTEDMTDGETFTVTCDNIFAIEGVTKDTAFVVYYEATLNEGAVIGGDGNPNEVYLEFSNDPYGDGTGNTEKDEVVVYTYKLVINKTDSHGYPLEGAGFTLYKKDISGTYNAIGDEQIGDGITTFTWIGLDDGDYKLEESTVPEGYNKVDDILFSISAEHSETAGVAALTSLDGGLMGEGTVADGKIEKAIVNNTGAVLPSTGAKGTAMLIMGGTMFVVIAAVFMITRKKMSVYED